MKHFKNLKYVAIICMLIAFNGCSNDNDLEIIDETSVEELNVISTKSGSSCDTQVALNYNFSPGMTYAEKQAYKVWYRGVMSQFFTICSVQSFGDSCPESEIWTVNGQEYFGNSNYPYNTQAFMDMIQGTGGGNSGGDDEADFEAEPQFVEDYDPDACWEAKENNLNNHLSGL